MTRLVIVLARNRPQIVNFDVFKHGQDHFVDIGKLIPCRVDKHAVRIALQHPSRLPNRAHRLPGGQDRQFRIEMPAVLGFEQVHPLLIALVLSHLIGFFLPDEIRVKLL